MSYTGGARNFRATLANLITMVQRGKTSRALECVVLIVTTEEEPRDWLRAALGELVSASADLVIASCSPEAGDLYELDLRDDRQRAVDIDRIDPPLRATMRALLARVNGQPAAAADQIELVLDGGLPDAVDCVLTLLQWTGNLWDWCRSHDLATPGWLAAA
jgi:hypothetical protein